jgi:hypothetical protein
MPAPLPAAAIPSRQPHTLPLSYTNVYVDDFCNLVQGNACQRHIARRILFHAIDEVIRPLDPSHDFHQEPISIKKTPQGRRLLGHVQNSLSVGSSILQRRP